MKNWKQGLLALIFATTGWACSGTDNACPDGFVECNGVCTDLMTSQDSCGTCGEACSDGEICSAGSCSTSCGTNLTECSGTCRDTQSDPANCGACGTVCGADEVCRAGSCEVAGGGGCASPRTECGADCVDTSRDNANCGACGTACGAGELCQAGSCDVVCGPGAELCGASCTNTQADPANCGTCGNACGAGEVCTAGACAVNCGGGAPDECNGACTNTQLDPANCGTCGNACGAGEVCNAGACQGGACPAPLSQCGQSCTSTLTDSANCGACGNACPSAGGSTAICSGGLCNGICFDGFADCNADLDDVNGNGCETNIAISVGNCGACGNVCNLPNAAAQCVAANCEVAACSMGFDDCDAAQPGCETDIVSDDNNCGACGNVCPGSQICVNSACIDGTGEDCSQPLTLLPGTATVAWMAMNQDYFPASAPSCSFANSDGPDVVFVYQATVNGFATLSMEKPASQRFFFVVSDAACGTVTPELACSSEFTPTTMSDTFAVTAGTTYYAYFSDTTSGTGVLPNPLDLTLTELDCATSAASVVDFAPVANSTTTVLNPSLSVTFDTPVNETVGIVTITGSLGTSLSYDLSLSPTEVDFDAAGTTMTIDPAVNFPGGEVVTVSWTGIVDALCGSAIAPPVWSFNIITPPCQPGTNGMIGTTLTRFPTTSLLATEYYAAADTSPTGWVYFGGTSDLFRAPKAGGTHEDLGFGFNELGYAMLIDGLDIYTLESATTGTTGHVYRISDDGGATFFQAAQDMAGLPAAPGDDFRGITSAGGLVYIITHEGTTANNTEIYAFDPTLATPTSPAPATLVTTFSGEGGCAGLAIDATNYYTACGTGERIIAVNRTTGVVTLLNDSEDLSGTINTVYGSDINTDGVFDYLYVQGWYEEGYFVCDPATATPFSGLHFDYGGANSNYGMGYDPVGNALWNYDDDTDELVRVQ